MVPSKYQQNIFDAVQNTKDNLIIEAVAGSGKTTTIIESLKLIDSNERVLFVAFNKHTADELKKKVPSNIEVSTLNSFGWRLCLRNFGRIKLDSYKTRSLCERLSSNSRIYSHVSKIVSLMKGSSIDNKFHEMDLLQLNETITSFALKHDLEVPTDNNDFTKLVSEVFKLSTIKSDVMDFDDQIFMPVFYNLRIDKYDTVMIDEVQDLSPIQSEFVSMIGNRIISVGDSRQSIYGFRGADPDSMKKMKSKFNMTELPLSICYRCPSSHIEVAKEIVPEIEAAPNAKEGTIETIRERQLIKKLNPKDHVLCRVSAPLIKYCLSLLATGKKGVVKGRDFGNSLSSLVDSLSDDSGDMNNFFDNVENYFDRETRRYLKSGRDTSVLDDKKECIYTLARGVKNSLEIKIKIDKIFSDKYNPGVTFSTVHRAKGLEANRVFILYPDLLPFYKAKQEWQKVQEMNLKYVAFTRSKDTLCLVLKDNSESKKV